MFFASLLSGLSSSFLGLAIQVLIALIFGTGTAQ